MVHAPFRARSRSQASRTASQGAQRSLARSRLLAYGVALTSQVKVCRQVSNGQRTGTGTTTGTRTNDRDRAVIAVTTVLDPILVGTGHVPKLSVPG